MYKHDRTVFEQRLCGGAFSNITEFWREMGDSGNPMYWKEYLTPIQAYKKSPEQVIFSGIVGPAVDPCYGVEAGNGYVDIINETGGEFLSICDPWQEDINQLVEATVSYPIFTLSQLPIESSIQVYVNEQLQSNWNYQMERN